MVALAGTGSDSAAEMHTAAARVRCIHWRKVAACSRKRVIGVQRSSVATDEEDMARCLVAHTDYTMAEVRLGTQMMPAAGHRRGAVAAGKARTAHTAMDCAGRLVGRTDCTGSASWLE